MLPTDFLNYLKTLKVSTGPEDLSERLNFTWTPLVLLMSTLAVISKQYLDSPIKCYFPDAGQAVGHFHAFAESYCYVYGTHAIEDEKTRPKEDMSKHLLQNYYQWVPFLLGLQTLLSMLPRFAWHSMCQRMLGSDLYQLSSLAVEAKTQKSEKFFDTAQHLTDVFKRMLEHSHEYRPSKLHKLKQQLHKRCPMLIVSKRMGTSLVFGYLGMKLLCCAACVGQLALMEAFLGFQADGHLMQFGYRMLDHAVSGNSWQKSHIFPLRSVCVVKAMSTGGDVNHVGQCTLGVNFISSKIYIFLFFWFSAMIVVTFFFACVWACRLGLSSSSSQFVHVSILSLEKRGLAKAKAKENRHRAKANIREFIRAYLRYDGLFVVLMLSRSADSVITCEVVRRLYAEFCAKNEMDPGPCARYCSGASYGNRKQEHLAVDVQDGDSDVDTKSDGPTTLSKRLDFELH